MANWHPSMATVDQFFLAVGVQLPQFQTQTNPLHINYKKTPTDFSVGVCRAITLDLAQAQSAISNRLH